MNLKAVMRILEVLVILQIIVAVQTSNVHDARIRKREENRQEVAQPRRWSHRRKLGAQFTSWTRWTKCDPLCKQTRERYCKVRRKCGVTKQVEERKCKKCHPRPHHEMNFANFLDVAQSQHRYRLPVYQEIYETGGTRGYYAVKAPPRYKKKKKPIYIEVDDYEDLEDEDDSSELEYRGGHVKSIRLLKAKRLKGYGYGRVSYRPSYTGFHGYNEKKNLFHPSESGQYEDEDYQESRDHPVVHDIDYPEDYEDLFLSENGQNYEIRNMSIRVPPKEKAVFDAPRRRRRVYSRWSRWSKCSPKCTTRRYKKCKIREVCGKEVLREIAYCYTEGSFCQKWLESQVRKSAVYDVKPLPANRMDILSTNSISNDYILSSAGYRAPEYAPLKLKCGIPAIRKGRKNRMQNMLKIIGGKTSRKGQWPWQVVIFNRFKEAFCGGTLIAPHWVLTAAHCVRKVLYVRLGEHNLDIIDGTEVEFRVTKSIKHPSYDKKTVDSDIALLRLPKPMNATQWIGYACMPQPFQPLPKNIQCTVIGWGKRRNNDQAGTSLLHQAEVPIIPMDNCKAVYHDYTITKNMFCAGHKRGRIDTCAGDSGGPLLCRDTTRPNHPWTIFGITSFGDGCAKRNKFGIYAKVPNYVDWVWSVVNCNGNCKSSAVHSNRS